MSRSVSFSFSRLFWLIKCSFFNGSILDIWDKANIPALWLDSQNGSWESLPCTCIQKNSAVITSSLIISFRRTLYLFAFCSVHLRFKDFSCSFIFEFVMVVSLRQSQIKTSLTLFLWPQISNTTLKVSLNLQHLCKNYFPWGLQVPKLIRIGDWGTISNVMVWFAHKKSLLMVNLLFCIQKRKKKRRTSRDDGNL